MNNILHNGMSSEPYPTTEALRRLFPKELGSLENLYYIQLFTEYKADIHSIELTVYYREEKTSKKMRIDGLVKVDRFISSSLDSDDVYVLRHGTAMDLLQL